MSTTPAWLPAGASVAPKVLGVGVARRTLDLVLGATLLVLALPLLAVTAALILLTHGSPVLFRQVRLGEGGRPFTLYKLRSMSVGSAGPDITASDDARITRIGAFLRRTSIDELPQLWHVVRGQMTLVGPRPESQALAARYPASCPEPHAARPGLTGPAQLRYRERSAIPPAGWEDADSWYLTVLVPIRHAADLEFLNRPTVGQTLRFLVMTGLFVLGLRDFQRPVGAPGQDAQTAPETE